MRTKLLLLIIATLFLTNSYSQEQCGTMKNLEEQIKKDPSIKERMIQIEKQNQEWIEKNGRGFKKHPEVEFNKNSNTTSKASLNTNDLCGYDNSYFTTITAPTTLNAIVSPSPNCTYGGEYVRVTNLVAGSTYRISTIGVNNFDTQITIYPAGGGNAVAFNDDWNGSIQSEIYFNPFVSGNYDILIDEFGCTPNQLCASLQVELSYIPRPVITIPIVVHIYHKGEPIGTGTNISVAQIQSQIDVLNQDFRRLNSNVLLSPAPFRGTSDDPLIQFCLAQQKPDGSPTNGIMRYLEPSQQDYANLIIPNIGNLPSNLQCLNLITLKWMIEASTIWNRDKYLNIWVSDKLKQLPPSANAGNGNNLGCEFDSGLLGLAQFPGETGQPSQQLPDYSLTDGVWVTTTAFGNTGNVIPPYNLGRTAVHEVGHWLNLRHTWGNDLQPDPQCNEDDLVFDTPKQSESSTGCNIFPFTDSCSEFFPGIMYMNHMDYSDDHCRSIFTYGQTARMDAALFNQRASLLTSPGCLPSTLGLYEFENKKIELYPNPTSSKVYFDNSNSNFKEVSIYNYLGQEVSKTSFTSSLQNQEIDMSTLATGVYVMKFSDGATSKSVKVVKQ
jgi:hypothetical protein